MCRHIRGSGQPAAQWPLSQSLRPRSSPPTHLAPHHLSPLAASSPPTRRLRDRLHKPPLLHAHPGPLSCVHLRVQSAPPGSTQAPPTPTQGLPSPTQALPGSTQHHQTHAPPPGVHSTTLMARPISGQPIVVGPVEQSWFDMWSKHGTFRVVYNGTPDKWSKPREGLS